MDIEKDERFDESIPSAPRPETAAGRSSDADADADADADKDTNAGSDANDESKTNASKSIESSQEVSENRKQPVIIDFHQTRESSQRGDGDERRFNQRSRDGRGRRDRDPRRGGRPQSRHSPGDAYIDEDTHVVYLISSLESMLKVANYVGFIDTSVYFSVEAQLRNRALDAVDRVLLYQSELGIQQLKRVIDRYPNLMLIDDVIQELDSQIDVDLEEIRKKREEFARRAPGEKDRLLETHNRICSLAEAITEFRKAVAERQGTTKRQNPVAFERILELLRYVDERLGVKRYDMRANGLVADILAAHVFQETCLEGKNVAVYTRDEDVKKLVSTSYRLVRSMGKDVPASIAVALETHNVVVLKYNFDKGVYSRYFESQTIRRRDEFIFPSKIREKEIPEILTGCRQLLRKLSEALPPVEGEVSEETGTQVADALRFLVEVYQKRTTPVEERIREGECLRTIGTSLGDDDAVQAVSETLGGLRRDRIQARLGELEEEGRKREGNLASLLSNSTAGPGRMIDASLSSKLEELSQQISTNVIDRLYNETALERGRHEFSDEELSRARESVQELRRRGQSLGDEEVGVSVDELAQATQLPPDRILKNAESNGVRREGRTVFLTLRALMDLLHQNTA